MPNNPPIAKRKSSLSDHGDPRSSTAWKKARAQHREKYPVCQRCVYLGIVDKDSVKRLSVHHIRGLETAKDEVELWELLLDPDNLLTLCAPCHKRYDMMELNGQREEAEDEGMEVRG